MTASSARRPFTPLSRLTCSLTLTVAFLAMAGCSFSARDDSSRKSAHRFSLFSYNIHSNGQQCVAEWGRAPALPPGLWQRIESRYELPNSTTNERIITERNWYAKHQSYLDRVSMRSSRYLYYVANQLEVRKLPGELALLPIVESAYNPFAVSTSQASGLWQFIPSTAKYLNMEMNWWFDARRDIPAATDSALNYLVFLRDHYNGDWLKALAAYNAGWGTIDRAVAKNIARGLPTDYWHLDVPAETAAYVPKLLALAQLSKNPGSYGITWAYIPDLPYFAEVRFRGQLDVAFAADMADVNSDELYQLNPGFSRWATPPGGPYRLLVPIDQANELQERIANMDSGQLMPTPPHEYDQTANPRFREMEERHASRNKPKTQSSSKSEARSSTSKTYVVKAGDTLWSVAKKSGISTEELRRLNQLSSDESLKLGQTIALSSNGKSAPGKSESSPAKTRSSTSKTAASTTKTRVSNTYAASTASESPKTPSTKESPSKNTGGKKTSYKVKSGDTLMAISRKYNMRVEDIAGWNGLNKNHASLKPGQTITLYTDH